MSLKTFFFGLPPHLLSYQAPPEPAAEAESRCREGALPCTALRPCFTPPSLPDLWQEHSADIPASPKAPEAKHCLATAEAGREAVADQALVDERAARRIAEAAQKAAQDEAASLQARLSSAEARADEAEARAQELEKQLSAVESRARKAEQALDSPRKKAEQAELARKEVESRNHELQERLAAAEAKAKKAEQLEEARKEAEARAQEMQRRLSCLEVEMGEVQQAALAFKEAQKQFQDVQKAETKKMEAIQAARLDAEARVCQLQNQVSSLETELARAKDTEALQEMCLAAQHDAEARATDLQRQVSGMETELKEVKQRLRSEKEKAEEKVQTLEERLLVLEDRASVPCVLCLASDAVVGGWGPWVKLCCRRGWLLQRPQQKRKRREHRSLPRVTYRKQIN